MYVHVCVYIHGMYHSQCVCGASKVMMDFAYEYTYKDYEH